MDESFRLEGNLAKLANQFQVDFMGKIYDSHRIEPQQLSLEQTEDIEYHQVVRKDTSKIWHIIESYRNKNNLSNNDICILSATMEGLRELEHYIRTEKGVESTTTFETLEMFHSLNNKDIKDSKQKIENLRRLKKFGFWMNTGKIKMSTIHSFKGWESHILVFILENSSKKDTMELMYTGLTRCKKNLLIINPAIQAFGVNEPIIIDTNVNKYEEFFRKNIKKHLQ